MALTRIPFPDSDHAAAVKFAATRGGRTVTDARIIKKYANRRLYDTAESRYIALEDIRRLVLAGVPFKVVDARSGDDITRGVLLQIIVEQEESDQSMLSTRLLEQIILYYGTSLQAFVRTYLEKSMESFISQQQTLQDHMETLLRMTPPSILKDMTEQNLKLWKNMQDSLFQGYAPDAHKADPDKEPDT